MKKDRENLIDSVVAFFLFAMIGLILAFAAFGFVEWVKLF